MRKMEISIIIKSSRLDEGTLERKGRYVDEYVAEDR